jgi:predicted DsbA family dithiol-disulfide isomerase
MKKLRVEVWSDIACPWCYVGKRRLDAALARFPQAGAVEVTWRAFELDPTAPRVRGPSVSYAERLARKYGTTQDKAKLMLENMTKVAAGDGLDFHFERIQSGNTFDAHRVIHLAGDRGLQHVTKERLLRAYFTDGEPIGEPEVLERLGREAGLDGDEVRGVLASDAYAEAVRGDEERAHALGIHGVPFFAIAGRYGVSGAQSADVLIGVLEQALAAEAGAGVGDGAVCGPGDVRDRRAPSSRVS